VGGSGWEGLIVWAAVPLLSRLTHTHTNKHTHTHTVSPSAVITVPIIIHASQGLSHADGHLDAHKHSNQNTPQLDFEPMLLNQPRSAPHAIVHQELLVISFSITQMDAGSSDVFHLGERVWVQH